MWQAMTGAPGAPRAVSRVEQAAIPADPALRAAIKAYLRIETADEDALIDRLSAVAIGHCEAFIGRMAILRQVQESLPVCRSHWQRLGCSPARTVTGVEALDALGDRIGWGAVTMIVRAVIADPTTPDRIEAIGEEQR